MAGNIGEDLILENWWSTIKSSNNTNPPNCTCTNFSMGLNRLKLIKLPIFPTIWQFLERIEKWKVIYERMEATTHVCTNQPTE